MNWIEDDEIHSDRVWGITHRNIEIIIRENIKEVLLGAEIGVAYASNSFNLLKNFPKLTLYSVDPYREYSDVDPMNKNVKGAKGDELYSYASNRLKKAFNERSIFFREDSDDFKLEVDDLSLDFVFIDGDHSYDGVTKDLNNMYGKVKIEGIISGDDYGIMENVFNVRGAVDDFCKKHNLKLNIKDAVWWIKKI